MSQSSKNAWVYLNFLPMAIKQEEKKGNKYVDGFDNILEVSKSYKLI